MQFRYLLSILAKGYHQDYSHVPRLNGYRGLITYLDILASIPRDAIDMLHCRIALLKQRHDHRRESGSEQGLSATEYP